MPGAEVNPSHAMTRRVKEPCDRYPATTAEIDDRARRCNQRVKTVEPTDVVARTVIVGAMRLRDRVVAATDTLRPLAEGVVDRG